MRVDRHDPPSRRPTSPATEARVRAESIAFLYKFPARLFGNVINAALVVFVLRDELLLAVLLPWLSLVCLVTAARYGLILAYRRAPPEARSSERWAFMYMAGSCLAAALWGAASATVWLTPNLAYPVFIAFAVAGTSAAATVMSQSHLPSVYGFLGLAVGPLTVNLLASGHAIYVAMGVMGLLFMTLLVVQARVSNRMLRESLLLKEENSALVADLSAARDRLEDKVRERTAELGAANATLQAEMAARQETEARLHQAQKMEAVGQLTGGIAHDFNNILGIVLGNLDLIAHSAKGDSHQMTLLQRAIEAAERGASLTHRLLAFSRRQTLVPAVIDINALMAGLTDLLQRALGGTIAITMHHALDLWRSAVDPSQLENAILNLAINARDAMPKGGNLIIETRNAADYRPNTPDGDAESGDYVVIAVSDTGAGMPKEVLDRALEPFFTTKGTGKGTGLGLSMVYGFVKQSGGHLEIESAVARGTTVRLLLPRAAQHGALDSAERLSAQA